MSDWTDEYRARMREFMEKNGVKVEVQEKRYDWQDYDEVSPYGWSDHAAARHVRPTDGGWPGEGCHWIVPEGARLYERIYGQFQDTYTDNKHEVGINVTGCRCACGRYEDVILRYTGTLADVMQQITGAPARAEVIL